MSIWRVLSQNALSAIFDIFKVRAPSYNTNNTFLMIHCSLYIKEYFWSYDQKYNKFSYYFSLYFSSLNLKYLKLTKMELSRFAMKLFMYRQAAVLGSRPVLISTFPSLGLDLGLELCTKSMGLSFLCLVLISALLGGISSSVLSVFFTDNCYKLLKSLHLIGWEQICQWNTLTKCLMKCPPGLESNTDKQKELNRKVLYGKK